MLHDIAVGDRMVSYGIILISDYYYVFSGAAPFVAVKIKLPDASNNPDSNFPAASGAPIAILHALTATRAGIA